MPYNPGVSSIGGQILGQGIANAAGSLAAGFQEAQRKQEQDKIWTAQSKATESLLKSYLPSDQADKVLAVDKNETPAARHARLSGTIENFVLQNKLDEVKRAQQQRVQDNAALQAALGQFMPQTTQQQIQGGANFAQLQPPGQQQKFDPERFMATYFQNKGSPEALDKVDTVVKAMSAPPRNPIPQVEPTSYRGTDDAGKPIQITVDKLTGRELSRGPLQDPKYVLTPEEQVQVAGQTEGAKKDAEFASTFVNSVPDAADAAGASLQNINEIEKLYAAGAKSGYGQEFLNGAMALGGRLGLVKPDTVANQQELGKLLAGNALQFAREVMKGGGSISDFERRRVEAASADLGKSPEANLKIVRLAKSVAQRAQAMEQQRQKLVDEGLGTIKVAEKLRRWRSANPLDNFMEDVNATATKAPASATGTAPAGVDAATWGHLTPEEKKLWQTN